MSLVDLISDLSKFRSDVSKESKSTPEASKATDSKNFATFQPITEKLSQFSVAIRKSEPKMLENYLDSTELDGNPGKTQSRLSLSERISSLSTTNKEPLDTQTINTDPVKKTTGDSLTTSTSKLGTQNQIRQFLENDLMVNRVSKYSNINESFPTRNLGLVTTDQVASKLSIQTSVEEVISTDPRDSQLESSEIVVTKRENGESNLVSKINISRTGAFSNRVLFPTPGSGEYAKTDTGIFSLYQKKPIINTIPKPQAIRIPEEIDNTKYSNTSTSEIKNPNIDVRKSVLSVDRKNESPQLTWDKNTQGKVEQSNNIENPNIQVDRKPQSFDRASSTPEILRDYTDSTDNIKNPNIQVERPSLVSDKTNQRPNNIFKIVKSRDTISDNITDPKIQVERTDTILDKSTQSPNVSESQKEGLITDPQIGVFRNDLSSNQLTDNSDLNVDAIVKTIPSGRNDNPDKSALSIVGLQEVNFLSDEYAKGFKAKTSNTTYYAGKSKYSWYDAPPSVNFITDQNGKGFLVFAKKNETSFNTNSSVFGFNTPPEVDFFDIKKTHTKEGFSSFVRQLNTLYKSDASVFTFKGNSRSAPTVDFFDKTKKVTKSGFDKFVQQFESAYISDSSTFTWKGDSKSAPQVDYFDLSKKNTTVGFHSFARTGDTKYKENSSQFDWDGTNPRSNAPQVNYFDVTKKFTTSGFHRFAQVYESKYIKDSSQFDWNGESINAPEVNYFDLNKQFTTSGFHKFARIRDTKYKQDSSQFDWDGISAKSNAPEVNYFDLTKKFTTGGFTKFTQQFESKYIKDSSQFDWNGQRVNAPEVNYFDLSKQFTTFGFHKFAQILDTKYKRDSSQFDWDGNDPKSGAPEVNYFDTGKRFTTAGFHKFARLLDTKYKKDSSQFDWDGTDPRSGAPQVNYFDVSKKFTSAGFHKFAALYDSKYNPDSSRFDWDGVDPIKSAPEVDYFDITKQFTSVGFHKFAAKYDSKYNPDSSEFDWDGNDPQVSAPEVNYFDITKRFTSDGFHKFAALYDTKYNPDSSGFDWDGSYPRTDAPEVNYFDRLNQFTISGFHKFARPYESMYIKDSSFFDWDGFRQDAPEVNYFDPFNIHTLAGFHKFAQIYDTKYKPEASRFDWEGTQFEAPQVDFFDITKRFASTGFHRLAALYDSKYIADSSQFDWDGNNPQTDAPEVNYFDPFNIHTLAGFHKFAQIYDTKYKPEASRFDWEGGPQDSPQVNYFDITSKNTTAGFHRLAQIYDSKYVHGSSTFDWDGPRADAPEVNFFDFAKVTGISGFHKFARLYDSKYEKDYRSILNSSVFDWDGRREDAPQVDFFDITKTHSTIGFHKFAQTYDSKYVKDSSRFDWNGTRINAPRTNFFGFKVGERTGFMGFMTSPNESLYPIVIPRLFAGDNFARRITTQIVRQLSRPLNTPDDLSEYVPALSGLFWNDGVNTGIATLRRQVPFIKISGGAAYDGSNYRDKYERGLKNDTQLQGYLTKWATKRNSNSPLDSQYLKYKLQKESVNREIAAFNQPFVVRGIQRDGEVENQRWGFGVTFDDGIVRGGLVTQTERVLMDLARLGKWSLSIKGGLFNVKQFGLQAMNPSVDVDPDTGSSGLFGISSTLIFNPLSILGNVATARVGSHFARHGLVPFDSAYLNKYETATKNRELKQRFSGETQRTFENLETPSSPGQQTNYSRLIGLVKELLPNTFNPTVTPNGDQTVAGAIDSAKNVLGRNQINRLTSVFGGAQSYFGIGGTTIRRSTHPYLITYTTSPNLQQSSKKGGALLAALASGAVGAAEIGLGIVAASRAISQQQPQYEDSAKRDVFFAYNYTYSNYVKDGINGIYGPGFLASSEWRTNESMNYDSLDRIQKLGHGERPVGRTISSRIERTTALNADSHLDPSQALINDQTYTEDKTYNDVYTETTQFRGLISELDSELRKPSDAISTGEGGSDFYSSDSQSITLESFKEDDLTRITKLNPYEPTNKTFSSRTQRTTAENADSHINPDKSLREDGGSFDPPNTIGDSITYGDAFKNTNATIALERLYKNLNGKSQEKPVGIREETLTKLEKLKPFDFKYKIFSERVTQVDELNADSMVDPAKPFDPEGRLYAPPSEKEDATYRDTFSRGENKSTLEEIFERVQISDGPITPPSGARASTMRKIKDLSTFDPKHRTLLERSTALTSDTAYTAVVLAQDLADGPSAGDTSPRREAIKPIQKYRTANYDRLKKNNRRFSGKFNDFRGDIRLDAVTSPFISDPDVINFGENNLSTKYGYGNHGETGKNRDNPAVTTICYEKGKFEGTYALPVEKNINNQTLEFRGDRINLIDYKRAKFNVNKNTVYEKDQNGTAVPGTDDLIEFYFTGVALQANENEDSRAIVFRASFDTINDNHNPSWSPIKYFGRGDPLYVYNGYDREIAFGFTVYISSRDELKAVWRKLNFLASWTAPRYLENSKNMAGPITRLNIGHLYRKMPGFISALTYTFDNQTATWETAGLSNDLEMTDLSKPGVLQLPKFVQVSVSFIPFGMYRPQYEGRFYSLFDDSVSGEGSGFETGLTPNKDLTKVNYFRHFDCDTNLTKRTDQSLDRGEARTDNGNNIGDTVNNTNNVANNTNNVTSDPGVTPSATGKTVDASPDSSINTGTQNPKGDSKKETKQKGKGSGRRRVGKKKAKPVQTQPTQRLQPYRLNARLDSKSLPGGVRDQTGVGYGPGGGTFGD